MADPKPLKRKCKICGTPFTTYDMRRWWCCPDCGVKCAGQAYEKARQRAVAKREREDREKIKAVRESLKTKHDYVKEAQAAVNKYIRIRDYGKPCISCGALPDYSLYGGSVDAGHYRSRGTAPHLRFYTLNISSQCKKCNRYGGGNYSEYRKGLIAKLGIEKVEAIDSDNRARHYTEHDLKRIKLIFNKKTRMLIKRKGIKR